jgi:hypothetical protein
MVNAILPFGPPLERDRRGFQRYAAGLGHPRFKGGLVPADRRLRRDRGGIARRWGAPARTIGRHRSRTRSTTPARNEGRMNRGLRRPPRDAELRSLVSGLPTFAAYQLAFALQDLSRRVATASIGRVHSRFP